MRRVILLALGLSPVVLVPSLTLHGQNDLPPSLVARTPPRSPEEERQGFRLPPGFEAQLVAAEPDIAKPMNIAFDSRGRLWVTDTVEYPFPAPPERKPRDSVKVLEDTDGDGRADKITTFADGLNIPIGLMPIQGGALVFSIPNIYRLLDTDGDGKADKREVLYSTYGFADTHGMTNAFTWGFDGWLYACHGFSNTSTVKGSDGAALTMHSGNTYRMRPDGSHLEQFTFGQVNPFGLSFDPLGNLYSADCHTKPLMLLQRGACYPSFGKPHDGLGFAPEICPHDHGSTAIAGVVHYAADQFPAAYRGTVFIGNVVTNRINHDRLEWRGSTPRAVLQPDFLISEDPWFRPVDLKLGPDGALYVADFYNRIIGHYEVPLTHPGRDRERGRIWRIVYRGPEATRKPVQPRPDWGRAALEDLVSDLGHPNLTVRILAANQLAERGGQPAIPALRAVVEARLAPQGEDAPAEQAAHALWVLERLGALEEPMLAGTARARPALLRVHAQRVLAERRQLSPALLAVARAGVQDADAFVRRAAAEALGTHADAGNVRPLLDLRAGAQPEDGQLVHAVRIALRNQLRPADTWSRLPLDQWSEADARALADVAVGVPSPQAAAFLLGHVQRLAEPRGNLLRYVHHIARHGDPATQAPLLAFLRTQRPNDPAFQAALLQQLHQGLQARGGSLDGETRAWAVELTRKLLDAGADEQVVAAANLVQAFQLDAARPDLARVLGRRSAPESSRLAALNALAAVGNADDMALLGRVLGDATESFTLREQAANALARRNRPEARAQLLLQLATAPARLAGPIAVGLASTPEGAAQLLDAVAAGKTSARLLQERPIVVRLEASRLPGLKERLAQLTAGLPPADQKLQELLAHRAKGFLKARAEPNHGAQAFEKHCAACHQIGGKGAKIGPQLDGIGARGVDRLLEDLVDPSRNVDQAFRATTLVLRNGQLVTGLVLREEGEIIVLADGQGKEVRTPKSAVEERLISPLSPMPANLVDQIPEQDFYHLLAYLLTQRTGTVPPKK